MKTGTLSHNEAFVCFFLTYKEDIPYKNNYSLKYNI
jgi:hypothetical protein